MQANLSRIHTLLTQTAIDIKRILDEAAQSLEANGPDFILPILESTTDSDLKGYLERLANRKKKLLQTFGEATQQLEYSFYLRRQMDAANRAAKVAEKLLEQNNIKKRLAHLYRLKQIISLSCSQGLRELKEASYYKSSFTENNKVYDLGLKMFSEEDYEQIQSEINSAEKASFSIGNEIAFINQTTMLEIMSFEEFTKASKAADQAS